MHSLQFVTKSRRKDSPKEIHFSLFEAHGDLICPLTQKPINKSDLDFLQGVTVCDVKPNHRGLRLACDHSFSAMALVFHWAYNRTVACPVCGRGHKDAHLNLVKLGPQIGRAHV